MNRINNKSIIYVMAIFLFIFMTEVFSQNFKVSSLIAIPGDNTEIDITSPDVIGIQNSETYICWLNKHDSIYTVFLKQMSPFMGDNIVVASDTVIKSKPLIALNRNDQGIKIVWQCKRENFWQVYLSNYYQNQLSEPEVILDSLETEPQIALSINRITWINNGDLLYANFYEDFSDKVLVDSLTCSSPDIVKYDYLKSTQILYEKVNGDSTKIHLMKYSEYTTPKFEYSILSEGILSKDPKFGMNMDLSFQIKEDNIWKSVYTKPYTGLWDTTQNKNCNYNNSVIFTYPIPISTPEGNRTPYFIAFDSDSISNNKEIFIKTFYYNIYDSLINISNHYGDDSNPKIAYLSTTDSVYVALIWEHSDNGKTDLWIAKDYFTPIITGVFNKTQKQNSFNLLNNYPNPFNPSTTIKYTLPFVERKSSFAQTTDGLSKSQSGDWLYNVTLKVYDILGREIATLVNKEQKPGNYKVHFDAGELTSGIYFYRLQYDSFTQSKKMILLK